MTATSRTGGALPPPIARYFAADTLDAAAAADGFVEDAIVVDEQRTYRGRDAIAGWRAAVMSRYHYTSEPLGAETVRGETVVTARISGDFPGSPANLRFRFTLAGDAIARLEITT